MEQYAALLQRNFVLDQFCPQQTNSVLDRFGS